MGVLFPFGFVACFSVLKIKTSQKREGIAKKEAC